MLPEMPPPPSRSTRGRTLSALIALFLFAAWPARGETEVRPVDDILDAVDFPQIETVLIAYEGEIIAERAYNEAELDAPQNIKSASKVIVTTLVGMAIDRGLLEGVDQPIAPLLVDKLPDDPDPRLETVTIGHLLSMQAGLERTSNENYAAWIASSDWVADALSRPFVAEPGGPMQYSTGSTHLLSAILTRVSERSTLELAEDWFGPIEGFEIIAWQRDPQGIYLGGNEMTMRPSSLLAFGEMIRRGGVTETGDPIVPEEWIEASWIERTRSRITGEAYGYGWYLREIEGEVVPHAWGFGGQMLYVIPTHDLTIVVTSNDTIPSAGSTYLDDLAALVGEIMQAVGPRPDPGS